MLSSTVPSSSTRYHVATDMGRPWPEHGDDGGVGSGEELGDLGRQGALGMRPSCLTSELGVTRPGERVDAVGRDPEGDER